MNNNAVKVRRGEIFYYDFGVNKGSIQNGLRPVLVVQCDGGNSASTTTIVAPITTVIKKRYLPSHILLEENCGLKKLSMVLLEQLKTINQCDLLERIGCVKDEETMRQVNCGLKKALGLWVNKKDDEKNIRCLCGKCLNDYMAVKDIIIKRYDPYDKIKQSCDKCNGTGYEYLIIQKHSNE